MDTTKTLTLTDFLLARIAEDEAVSRAAEHADGPHTLHWSISGRRHLTFDNGRSEDYVAVRCGDWDRILVARDAARGQVVSAHIARHDPARILAECEAKRRIVERASRPCVRPNAPQPSWPLLQFEPTDAATLSDLAAVYADHPDYRDEWRP